MRGFSTAFIGFLLLLSTAAPRTSGSISYDRSRKAFVFRQFYVAQADNPLTFATEAIENIPEGYRAREVYRIESPTEFVETFSLAEPGKDFAIYSETRLKKRR